MRALMKLAKDKQTAGMLPICEDMISKTRILLSLWDPGLVEEALSFVEEHKVAQTIPNDTLDGGEDSLCSLELRQKQTLSPYKRITQQLNFDLRSPDLDDLVTPDSPRCARAFWNLPSHNGAHKMNGHIVETEMLANYNCRLKENEKTSPSRNDNQFVIFPEVEEDWKENSPCQDKNGQDNAASNTPCCDDDTNKSDDCSNIDCCDLKDEETPSVSNGFECDLGRRFLDTQAMCSSPSANYYKPTDEPEPWDLTQLNIEASVMCLVSKVKFLCGRCGSPAVRLRSSQHGIGRSRSFRSGLSCHQAPSNETLNKETVVTIQPLGTNGGKNGSRFDIAGNTLNGKRDNIRRIDTSLDDIVLTANMSSDDVLNKAVDTVQKAVNGAVVRNGSTVRNKFTEGLDFSAIVDWTC
ncbi:unnamed protein product, partial [Timema podura]|nr:unnamed protein product [Timema podura]